MMENVSSPQASAIEKRAHLESEIAVLVKDFTHDTGLLVEHIEIELLDAVSLGGKHLYSAYGVVRITAVLP